MSGVDVFAVGETPIDPSELEDLPEDGDAPDEITEEPVDEDVGEPSDIEEDN